MGLIYMVNASPTAIDFDIYRQRKPQDSAYYRCVEDCFETLEQVYQERFEQKCGIFFMTANCFPIFHGNGMFCVSPTADTKALASGS